MTARYTLGKSERLKSRKSIDRLFEKGQRFNIGPLRVYHLKASLAGLRAGVSVSSRNFSRATDRNRVKRLLRETYRLQKQLLLNVLPPQQGLDLFFVYTDRQLPEFSSLKLQMETAISKIATTLGKA